MHIHIEACVDISLKVNIETSAVDLIVSTG